MKVTVLMLGISMLYSFNGHSRAMSSDAGDGCVGCHRALSGQPLGSELSGASGIVNYTQKQYQAVANQICDSIDNHKQGVTLSIERKMCTFVPNDCSEGKKHLDIRGIVRVNIGNMLSVGSSQQLESSLPTILSELMKYPCSSASSLALPRVKFHNQRRNIAKRAIFAGQTTSFFENFIFKDYEYNHSGQRKLKVDINAVEVVDGERETLLDYVDKVLAPSHNAFLGRETRGNINALKNDLIRFGAKRASEL